MEEGSPGLGCLRIRRKPPGGPIRTSPGSQGSGCRVTGVLNIGFHFAQFCTHGGINRAEISALSLLPTDPEKQEVKPTSGISRVIKCSVCPCTLCTLCLERGTSECPSRDSFTDEQAPTSPRRGGRVHSAHIPQQAFFGVYMERSFVSLFLALQPPPDFTNACWEFIFPVRFILSLM